MESIPQFNFWNGSFDDLKSGALFLLLCFILYHVLHLSKLVSEVAEKQGLGNHQHRKQLSFVSKSKDKINQRNQRYAGLQVPVGDRDSSLAVRKPVSVIEDSSNANDTVAAPLSVHTVASPPRLEHRRVSPPIPQLQPQSIPSPPQQQSAAHFTSHGTTSSSSSTNNTDHHSRYGYVFVLLGNLTDICCDCWLGPSGSGLDVRRHHNFPKGASPVVVGNDDDYYDGNGEILTHSATTATTTTIVNSNNSIDNSSSSSSSSSTGSSSSRVEYMGKLITYEPWPVHVPKAYTVHLHRNRGRTDAYIAEIERYIRVAAKQTHEQWKTKGKPRKGVCPLLATPLLGTGMGGNYRKTGELVKKLLPLLYRLADELQIDIAIVTIEEEVFSLTQSLRRQLQLDLQHHLTSSPPVPALASTASSSTASSSSSSSSSTATATDTVHSMVVLRAMNAERYLRADLIYKLKFLASQAVRGELTLFVGAGASMGSGLPSWADLLKSVATQVGLEKHLLEEFNALDYYAKAAVLEQRISRAREERYYALALSAELGPNQESNTAADAADSAAGKVEQQGPQQNTDAGNNTDCAKRTGSENTDNGTESLPALDTLGEYIARALTSADSRVSIAHTLMSSLPVKEIITTNYDNLMERAWMYTGQFSVLPSSPVKGCSRWLLKLHGSTDRPEEIVLTKRNYMRYQDRFAALTGIVQSTLLTRHLLCVGFSLDDDNFQRAFDSVQKARSPLQQQQQQYGSPGSRENSFSSLDNGAIPSRFTSEMRTTPGPPASMMFRGSSLKGYTGTVLKRLGFATGNNNRSNSSNSSSNSSHAAALRHPRNRDGFHSIVHISSNDTNKQDFLNKNNNSSMRFSCSTSSSDDAYNSSCSATALMLPHSHLKRLQWEEQIDIAFFEDPLKDTEAVTTTTTTTTAAAADNNSNNSNSNNNNNNNNNNSSNNNISNSSTNNNSNNNISSSSTNNSSSTTSSSSSSSSSTTMPKKETDFWGLARLQEIFLDQLNAECAQSGSAKFLMKDRYADALSEGEIELKQLLQGFAVDLNRLSSSAKQSKAFKHVQTCLKELGR